MASNYNMVARPPVVSVRGGVDRIVLRRETEADMFALDAGLADAPS
jgi:diaminopimelate decarboxylase